MNARRPWGLALLAGAVLAIHGCATQWLADHLFDGSVADPAAPRMEVAYVREMAAESAPPAAAAPAAPPVRATAVGVAAPLAASAPEPAASRPPTPLPKRPEVAELRPVAPLDLEVRPDVPPEQTSEQTTEQASEKTAALGATPEATPAAGPPTSALASPPAATLTPELARTAASAVAPAADLPSGAFAAPTVLSQASPPAIGGESSLPAFDWPVSTRLSYRLSGNVRGEVNGDAQVEWIRVDRRYQVHLDVTVGLAIAPLMTRRMSSDGEITAEGLSPRRYDQDTKIGFGARQRVTVLFEPGAVVLAGGQRRERWPGMQDTASQFIQLSYLFGTRPELLRAGNALEVPLALPRNTPLWVYDVIGEETVHSPIGAIAAVHLKPRRSVVKGGDLSAEIWFAPSYRYLPVRIRIQQDAETFIDLVVARKPELGAP